MAKSCVSRLPMTGAGSMQTGHPRAGTRASRTCERAPRRCGPPTMWAARPVAAPVSSSRSGRGPDERRATEPMDEPRDRSALRLLVVDDHEVVRQGLVALLDRREGFEVVAQ